MSRFLKQKMLFHAIPWAPEGDSIRTSINYGAHIPGAVREKLGMPPEEHTPLVFAATTLGKALAFTHEKGEALFNQSIGAEQAEILVVCNRDAFMQRVRDARVYTFAGTGFTQLPNAQNQCVSTKPVPFAAAKEILQIKSAEDMMRAGLQIFSFKEDFHGASKLLEREDGTQAPLKDLVKSGQLVWENHARGINPNYAVAKELGLPAAQQPKAQTRRKTKNNCGTGGSPKF